MPRPASQSRQSGDVTGCRRRGVDERAQVGVQPRVVECPPRAAAATVFTGKVTGHLPVVLQFVCATGRMSDGQATVERLQLTAEMHELMRPSWQKTLIVLFWIGLTIFLAVTAVQLFILAVAVLPNWLPKT